MLGVRLRQLATRPAANPESQLFNELHHPGKSGTPCKINNSGPRKDGTGGSWSALVLWPAFISVLSHDSSYLCSDWKKVRCSWWGRCVFVKLSVGGGGGEYLKNKVTNFQALPISQVMPGNPAFKFISCDLSFDWRLSTSAAGSHHTLWRRLSRSHAKV